MDKSPSVHGSSSPSRSQSMVREPSKPKQFSLKDLAVYSKNMKEKDIKKKKIKSMFKGKYMREQVKKKKNQREDEEDDAKVGDNHDWKETPVYK